MPECVSSLVTMSEAVSLALHAMALLATQEGHRFTNQAIAERLQASGHHLAKVMHRLVKAGLVDSSRGPLGGFDLNVPAEEIKLLQIYEAVEGPISSYGCPLSRPACQGRNCVLSDLVRVVHQQIRDYLARTDLAELALGLAVLGSPG
ncbi:MAG: Rrf2 family transcriptional regulator [Thermoguttaceae bacterium]|jgi:Rrf2 family protein